MGKKVLGLEIGAQSVTLAVVKNGRKLLGCEIIELPDGVYSGGSKTLTDDDGDIGSLALFIKETTERNKLFSRGIDALAVCVNNAQTVVRPIALPAIPNKELASAVEYELSQSFPGVAKTNVISFKEYTRNKKQISGVASFAPRQMLEPYRRLITALGYKNAYIDVGPNSEAKAYNMFAEGGKSAKTCLVCDIDGNSTQIIIVQRNRVRHSRQIPEGDSQLKDIFCSKMGIGESEFEAMRSNGMKDVSMSEAELGSIIRLVYSNIVEQVQQTVEFYNLNGGEKAPVTEVVLAGCGSVFPGLDKYFASVLDVQAGVIRPVKSVKTGGAVFARALPAIGAAVRED